MPSVFRFLPLLPRAAAAAAVLSAFAAAPAGAQDVQTVKIGHAGPVSGGIAHIGKDTENGVRMAVDDLNAQNLVIGGKKIRFEIAAEDDAGDPRQATAIAQKFCDLKVAGVVGHLQSGTSIPASSLYDKCGLPNITAAATNPDLTKPGYKTTFRLIANDSALGAALAIYAADHLKLKTVAVIDDRTAYGQGVAQVFKATALQKGLKVVAEEFTNDKATDFMAILTSIKPKKPDAIFYGGLDAQAGPMLRQMEQLGMGDVKFFGGDALCTEKLPDLSAKSAALKNVTCATGGASVAKMQGGAEWKKRYDAKFPGQFQIYSPYAYDAAMVLVDAMKRADSVDPKVYTPFIAKTQYKGVTANVSFTPKGELTAPAVTLYHYPANARVALN
ncbi:branched-chain amino acid ABC transporter substrate-binding protein [Paracidovorax avenae]|uniref:branched-chain amino acid ABC transporter substrate-binding protein n=1 Tax=Paracidovorax avenae TaxID=80867 RepID=UPI000D15D8FF|nr:branched-chain amino acid ABC transporter substrate-binding protein [Paracidovorax avenae]AVS88397.1 branched chain amino acid ABC transporter substrate-binding protein [Paracidovorax avenae]AVS95926.1 branched chain amino acid ABC transporter substrate-binding protein [Paracidovorax avenae]AVT02610.1 branched chain amino acid ABC transporter substrate-binding protein [Paracidovorax avenae]AVT09451.1 branched chain amino acid ABC transporter substrate-binding protein [Paracidovorax avenae]